MIKLILAFFFATAFLGADTEFAEPKPTISEPRKIIFSIKNQDDKAISGALSVVNNVLKVYGPEKVNMRIVAYSGAIRILLKKEEAIAARIKAFMELDVSFVACENAMNTRKIKKEELLDGVEVVSSGIVETIEKQQDGWIHIAL